MIGVLGISEVYQHSRSCMALDHCISATTCLVLPPQLLLTRGLVSYAAVW